MADGVQRLAGKIAVVTGGGNGIGKGIGELFAEEGACVVILDNNDEAGRATAARIEAAGGKASFHHCDIGVEADIAAMAQAVTAAYGGTDILVNNAGVHLTKGTLETSTDEWDRCIAVDLRGAWLCTKYLVPAMQARGRGSVVNISSVQGVQTQVNFTAYGAAKAGVIGMTRNMALDLAPAIRVNCVLPGYIWTPLYDRWLEHQPAGTHESVQELQPLKRIGLPRDVAQGCLFLAGDESSWITGTTLTIDGGLTARLHN